MREQFEHELARSITRIQDAIAPYTRFVRSSHEKLTRIEREMTALRNELRGLRMRIGDDPELASGMAPALSAGQVMVSPRPLPAGPSGARANGARPTASVDGAVRPEEV